MTGREWGSDAALRRRWQREGSGETVRCAAVALGSGEQHRPDLLLSFGGRDREANGTFSTRPGAVVHDGGSRALQLDAWLDPWGDLLLAVFVFAAAVAVQSMSIMLALCMVDAAMRHVAAIAAWCRRKYRGPGLQRVAWAAAVVGGRRVRRRTVVSNDLYLLIAGRADGRLRIGRGRGLHVASVRRGGIVVLALGGRTPRRLQAAAARRYAPASEDGHADGCGRESCSGLGSVSDGSSSGGLSPASACAAAHGGLRVGEAAVPGPAEAAAVSAAAAAARRDVHWEPGINASPLTYPRPGKVGFYGCHTAGFRRADDLPPEGQFTLLMETVNATGWQPLARHLGSTEAHVIFVQEHRLGPEDVAGASAWTRRHGWRSVWAAAVPGPNGGMSAGTAIIVRDCCGLRHPDVGQALVEEGRAVSAVVEPPGGRPFLGVAAYLYDGEGLGRRNLELAAKIGDHIAAQGVAMPLFAIGADWNLEPEVLARARLADRLSGKIVAPSAQRKTCRTRTAARTYDYFYVSAPLAELISDVDTVEGTGIRTHVPVRAVFYPRLAALRALGVRQPPRLPTERVFGPLPPPTPKWAEARRVAEEVCAMARGGGDEEAVLRRLDAAYAIWADCAECDLQDITGTSVPKAGCRSAPPAVAWRSILPEGRGGDKGQADELRSRPVVAWAWLADLLRDAARLASPLDAPHWCRAHADIHDQHRCPRGHHPRGNEHERREDRALADALMAAAVTEAAQFSHIAGFAAAAEDARGIIAGLRELTWNNNRDRAARGEQSRRRNLAMAADQALQRARAEHDKAAGAERKASLDGWRRWLLDGFNAGARNAHRYVRLPVQWRPTEVVTPEGVRTADPFAVLEDQRAKYSRLWKASDDAGGYRWRERTAMPRLKAEELREASRRFRRRTASTFDGFHCRHYALLEDDGLDALAAIIEACELMGRLPPRLGLVTTPLLEKPRGGYRPISVYPSLYRLWAKARSDAAQRWESDHQRPFFSATAGNGPCDTVWRQAVRQERAVDAGGAAATLLWDLESFFEVVDRGKLYQRALDAGFPEPILRLSLGMYSAPRVLALDGWLARELWPTRGSGRGVGLHVPTLKFTALQPWTS